MTNRSEILNELLELSPELARLNPQNPYKVPSGYFEGLTAAVMTRVKAEGASASEELELLSPLLNKLDKKAPFTVPDSYFGELTANTLNKLGKKEPAKIISASFTKRIFRYAAAAVVIGLIAAGTWLFVKQPSINTDTAQKENSTVENNILQKIQDISDSEMNNYIEGSSNNFFAFENTNPGADIKDDDVALMLANVPDEELQQYIEQHNSIKEAIN